MTNSSFWHIDRIILGATTPGQSGPGSYGNEGIFNIPQISKTGASPLHGLRHISNTRGWSLGPLLRRHTYLEFVTFRTQE